MRSGIGPAIGRECPANSPARWRAIGQATDGRAGVAEAAQRVVEVGLGAVQPGGGDVGAAGVVVGAAVQAGLFVGSTVRWSWATTRKRRHGAAWRGEGAAERLTAVTDPPLVILVGRTVR
jgi:hypothetical protein